MKRPIMLLAALLTDVGREVGVSTARDVETIRHRVKHEGFSFLTMTLPVLSDYLEKGIENGYLSLDLSSHFRFESKRSLPRFLGGFFRLVFDDAGMLLNDPDPYAIKAIRQVSRCFKKIFEVCDDKRSAIAAERYIQVEKELKAYDEQCLRPDPILDQVALFLGRDLDETPRFEDLDCRHGPGSTADRLTTNGRVSVQLWYPRSEHHFPLADHAIPNWGCYRDLDNVRAPGVDGELPVRVVFVPKTALTPRVIAIEPSHMQYMQQACMKWMVNRLERGRFTGGQINFSDQKVNQQLARRGSESKWLATIDLKDASDRVHMNLAERILRKTSIWGHLEACRSRTACLPDGTTLTLRKFASQGSATCFPVEAYVFFVLLVSAIHVHRQQMPTEDSVRSIAKDVWVYGDDIVIPSPQVDGACDYLESYGLKVNRTKSFSKSHFRESCGGDFFKGIDVKPVYFRQRVPNACSNWTPTQILAWTSTSNQLYMAGYWESSQVIREWIEKEVGRIPRASVKDGLDWDNPSGVIFVSVAFNTELQWSKDYQAHGWKVRSYVNRKVSDPVLTYSGALYKGLKNIGMEHSTNFLFSNRRDGLTPKHRWLGL